MSTREPPVPDHEVMAILRKVVNGPRSKNVMLPSNLVVSGGIVSVALRPKDVAEVAAGTYDQFKPE